MVILPNAGHACYLDAPELFHKEVSAWMESVDKQMET
jgi:pimeloyl-ACP methyl ester carboxylesterase